MVEEVAEVVVEVEVEVEVVTADVTAEVEVTVEVEVEVTAEEEVIDTMADTPSEVDVRYTTQLGGVMLIIHFSGSNIVYGVIHARVKGGVPQKVVHSLEMDRTIVYGLQTVTAAHFTKSFYTVLLSCDDFIITIITNNLWTLCLIINLK